MKYYLTTPIYYVNAAPHIGHAYTTIAADAIKRIKRMQGYEVALATGTDEHGQKVARAAQSINKTPQQFTDLISAEFKRQWDVLKLDIDYFQRTTAPNHAKLVQEFFERCRANGYIYKSSYTGEYCVSCELYVNDAKPGDECPDCGRKTETVTEENFYFKLSAFQDRLLALLEKPITDDKGEEYYFVEPVTRRNEIIAFVKQGLQDVSISRTTIDWGIPIPGAEPHVFYVWFDALNTYRSAVEGKTSPGGESWWPADLHLIGKEILRFHAVYWPAFLWAADLPLPKRLFAHGWLLFENDKMSKTKGNIVRATPIRNVLGTDALRYFLLREVPFGQDGSFSYDALLGRYNSDLANGLGNLASRTLAMIRQNCDSKIPKGPGEEGIAKVAAEAVEQAFQCYDQFDFSRALEATWNLIAAVDKFIVERAPWKAAKEGNADLVADTLYTSAEALRLITALAYPVIPQAAEKIWKQLGMKADLQSVRTSDLAWGQLAEGQPIGEAAGVFPRADVKLMSEQMREGEAAELARQKELLGQAPSAPPVVPKGEAKEDAKAAGKDDDSEGAGIITIDDFFKVELRVGQIKTAERVPKTDKLIHMSVDVGEAEPRSIVAGIAMAYEPEALVGRKVVVVANLAPRKMRGLVSQGMLCAASVEGGKPVLAGFHEDIPVGARLS